MELSGIVKEITGFRGSIVWDSSKPDGTLKKLLDISKLKKLGFAPEYTVDSGIRSVYRDYLTTTCL
jgi:GDP-L-fucose synthase